MNDRITQTLQFGSVTIVVHRPVLTESERIKREQAVRGVMEGVMRDHLRRREAQKCKGSLTTP